MGVDAIDRQGLSGQSDAQLVETARLGDRRSFAVLISRHLPMLRAMCSRLVGDSFLAEDIAQDAVVTALLRLDRLRSPASFGSWLAGIGLIHGRRVLQEQSRRPLSLDAIDEDAAPDVLDLVEARDLVRRVRHAVGMLPLGQRSAVTAFYLAGLSYKETAQHLGASLSGVKTRLHKARDSLREQLADLDNRPHAQVEENAMPNAAPLASPVPDERVRMRITDLRRETGERPYRHVVVLTEVDGERMLPIWIGPSEATTLALRLENIELPRPDTYQLTNALLAAVDTDVSEIVIRSIVSTVYYAHVVLTTGAAIDARPSDALNLALLSNAPIYAETPVLTDTAANAERVAARTSVSADYHAIAAEAQATIAGSVGTVRDKIESLSESRQR